MEPSQTQQNGLLNIASSAGTQHALEAPPEQHPGERHEDWVRRYDEWYWRMHTWRIACRAAGREDSR